MPRVGLPSPFLTCDIRGRYPDVVDEALFFAIGRALGERWRSPGSTLLVGDVRHSTPALIAALAAGIGRSDLTVAWPIATPLAYFASRRLGFAHTLIVTASHNPAEYNGLKLLNGRRAPTAEELCHLRAASELLLGGAPPPPTAAPNSGAIETWVEEYEQALVRLTPASRPLRLVADAGNGCYGGLAAAVLGAAGHQVVEINGKRDGSFPGRGPDPTGPGALRELAATVRRCGADLGVGFDGDGDRAVFVDERGERVSGDATAALLATEAWERAPDRPLVFDVRTSRLLARRLTDRGAEIMWSYPGHALVRAQMLDSGASFAGELSGHYFFSELGHDDGLYAALRLAALVGRTAALSSLVGELPQGPGLDEIRVPYGGAAAAVYDALESADLGARVERGPMGMALTWDGAWALVRPSITEPLLTIRAEADTGEELERLRARLRAALAKVGVEVG